MRKILLAIVIAPLFVYSALRIWYHFHTPPLAEYILPYSVETGDLILTIGHSFKSDIVKSFEKKRVKETTYSHIGFIVCEEDSLSIVHMSIDDGNIKCEPLRTFIPANKVVGYDIFRIREDFGSLNKRQLKKILDEYLLDKKGFDYLFDLQDDTRFYCTELILHVLQQQGIKELNRIRYTKYIYPNDLVHSGLLKKV